MDFSDIPASHPSGIGTCTNLKAGVLGIFKDENNGNPIVEFVGLRPKIYFYSVCEAQSSCSEPLPPIIKTKQTAKGISRSAKRTIRHYVSIYNEGALRSVTNYSLVSRLNQIYTVSQIKRGLCPYYDKRYLLANLINGKPNPNTHAFGHYELSHEAALPKIDQPSSNDNLYVYQFRNRQELRDNDSKYNSSTTLQSENLLQRKHKQAMKQCAKHFSLVIDSPNMSNLNAMINSTGLNLEESLDVELNGDNESDNKQDKAKSNDEYDEEEHLSKNAQRISLIALIH